MLREVGGAGASGRDHLELAGAHDRHGARRARLPGSRFAYLRATSCLLEFALVRWALEKLRGHGFEPVDPAGAGARGGAVRHRLPARHRAADLPRCPTTSSTSSARARSRSPRCTPARSSRRASCRCATPASPPASAARPGAAGSDTRGIFRVHQFDKVEMFAFVAPEASPAEHERLLAIEEEILAELGSPTASSTSRSTTSAPRRASSTSRRGCPGRALPRADLVLEHDRLPGAAPRRPRSGPTAASPRTRTRSTAPRSPSAARSSRCSRTASARTARSSCPRR